MYRIGKEGGVKLGGKNEKITFLISRSHIKYFRL